MYESRSRFKCTAYLKESEKNMQNNVPNADKFELE